MKRLSKKQQAFIYYKARGYSNIDSTLKAGYKVISNIQASKMAYQLLQLQDISEGIETERTRIFDKSLITEEYVLDNLNEIVKSGKIEANKVQALKLLGQYKAMFTERTEIKGDMTLNPAQEKKIDEYITNRLDKVPQDTLN